MSVETTEVEGITHQIHVQDDEGEITSYDGVLDAMRLPGGGVKFYFNGELKEVAGGTIVRSQVKNAEEVHRYACPECDGDESALVTATDYGETIDISCPECGCTDDFSRGNL